jgi:hypothetical protein
MVTRHQHATAPPMLVAWREWAGSTVEILLNGASHPSAVDYNVGWRTARIFEIHVEHFQRLVVIVIVWVGVKVSW